MKIHITNCPKKTPYHYVNLIADAFKKLGHDVFEFDDNEYSSSYLKIDSLIRRSPIFALTKKNPEYFDFKQKHKNFIGKQWFKTLKDFKPDLLLVINSGWISFESIKIAKENFHIPKSVCWVVDDPGVSAAEDLVGTLPYYDIVFSTDPGWISFIKFFNQNVFYLPLASSELIYKPLDIRRDLDFSFVGSFFIKDPAGFFRAFIISHLPKNYKVEIYGPGINCFKNIYPELKNFNCFNKHIDAGELNHIWNRSKLTAVIYHPQVREGSAPRVFDAALAKIPQIIQYTPTIIDLFPGIDLPLFNSIPEFISKTDYYLNRPKESQELAEVMFDIVKNKHLFIHRAKTIIEFLDKK
ncbi:MAG: glycosyltransferase [Patescibacteria group bacterium]